MPVISDYECKWCSTPFEAWSDLPGCRYCGGTGERRYSRLNTPEWGGPRYITSLMRTFASRSEEKAYLKANGLREAAGRDKYGGAYPNDIAPPRESRIYFDPRSPSGRSKGTSKRLDEGY